MTTSLVFELGAYTQVDKRAANSTHGTKHKDWLIVKNVNPLPSLVTFNVTRI